MKKTLASGIVLGLLALTAPALAQDQSSANQTTPSTTQQSAELNTDSSTPNSAVITSVNINTASAEQLALLSGIGAAKAAAIISYREQNGPFSSIDDLAKVSGIGAATVDKNRHLLTQ